MVFFMIGSSSVAWLFGLVAWGGFFGGSCVQMPPNLQDSWLTSRYTWTGTWCATCDCSKYCQDTAEAYEICEYDAVKVVITGKKCKCHCNVNQRIVPCLGEMTITKGYGCDGRTLRVTGELKNGREVYQGGDRWVFWSGSRWVCGESIDSNGFSFCTKRSIAECKREPDSDEFKVEGCKAYYREDGHCGSGFSAPGFAETTAVCNPEGQYPCCRFGGDWCGKEAGHCTGTRGINFKHVYGTCLFWDVYMATKNVDFCDITPLDEVGNEIGKQRLWNLAEVLLGSIPEVGHVFDMFFAMMDPVSPITSPFALANNIINAVNEQIDSLQNCMYAQLAGVYVATLQNDFGAIFQKIGGCYGAYGDEKITCIRDSFWDLHGQLDSLSRPPPGDQKFISYFELLPLYQSIYQTYMVVAAGRLGDLQKLNDGCNFNNTLNAVKYGSQILVQWANELALNSIVREMKPPSGWDSTSSCSSSDKDGMRKFFSGDDLKIFGEVVLKGSCSLRQRNQMRVAVKMTNERENWCHFRVDKPTSNFCDDDYAHACEKMVESAKNFVGMIENSLTNHFTPAYIEKFVVPFRNFTNNLEEIPEMSCDPSSSAPTKEWSEFTGATVSKWTPRAERAVEANNKFMSPPSSSPDLADTDLPKQEV